MRVFQVRWVVMVVAAMVAALLPLAAGAQEPPQDRSELEHACPAGDVPDSGFTDTAANTHEDAIDCAAWWDITQGGPGALPPSQYGPTLPVYRDQMASFIARMIDEADGTPLPAWDGQNRFDDVDSGNVHVQNINRLERAGVVEGRGERVYAPKMEVRRDQMASFIARAIHHVSGVDRASDTNYFVDVPQGNPHRLNINGLFEEGVVQGRAPGLYAPADWVHRDAMAAFVMRGLDLHVEEGDATPPEGEPGEPPSETPEETPGATPEPSSTDQNETDAPELASVEVVEPLGATTVVVRYTFHDPVRAAVDHERFLLYGVNTDTQRFVASDAVRESPSVVRATFTREEYDSAVAASVAFNAVSNIDGRPNPELTLGLKGSSFPGGETSAPDLVSITNFRAATGEGTAGMIDVDFVFNEEVAAASTSGSASFGLVLADGRQANGNATQAAPNSTTVTVRLTPPQHSPAYTATSLEADTRRAFTQNGAVEDDEGDSSPRRAITVADAGTTGAPDLVSITLNKSQHRVVYEFNQPVSTGAGAPQAGDFAVYYIDGTQRSGSAGTQLSPTPPQVSSDRRTVTVQFANNTINDLIVGASTAQAAVTSLDGPSGVDSMPVPVSFPAGHALGPRLLSATKSSTPTGFSVTWRFDKGVSLDDVGALAVYLPAGGRITTSPSTNGSISPTSCNASGSNITCSVLTPPGTDLKLAAVAYGAVENSADQTGASGTRFPNYEQARPI